MRVVTTPKVRSANQDVFRKASSSEISRGKAARSGSGFFLRCRVEWSGHHAVRSTRTQCTIVSRASSLGNNLQFFASSDVRRRAHIEHFHACPVLQPYVSLRLAEPVPPLPNLVCLRIVCTDSEHFASFHHHSRILPVVPCSGTVRERSQADAGSAVGSAHKRFRSCTSTEISVPFSLTVDWRKHCQGPIGVHLCHQHFRFFHACQEIPLLGAVENRESVFHSHTPSVCWRVSCGGG